MEIDVEVLLNATDVSLRVEYTSQLNEANRQTIRFAANMDHADLRSMRASVGYHSVGKLDQETDTRRANSISGLHARGDDVTTEEAYLAIAEVYTLAAYLVAELDHRFGE